MVNRKETRQISFRVNQQEYERLQEMASNLGVSIAMFCKKKSQGVKLKTPNINREGAILIANELRKIGNNINQIAKIANTERTLSGEMTYLSLKEISEELANIWQSLNSEIRKVPTD